MENYKKVFEKDFAMWFKENGRDLPWRKTRDSYAIWVSEIMLQQTQVSRVRVYYHNFLKRFPTVQSLAEATLDEVFQVWRGLGYYRRARNMHKAAKILVEQYEGEFPKSYENLKKLPGIGSYTAAAIASFAFNEDVPALDTNIKRVLARVLGEEWEETLPKKQFAVAQKLIPKGRGAIFNHGLMDIGATICTSKVVQCSKCPLENVCKFTYQLAKNFNPAQTSTWKISTPSLVLADKTKFSYRSQAEEKVTKVAVGVLFHEEKILISKRPNHVEFGGYFEFPGGKLEPKEDERACLKREFKEELDIEVAVRPAFYRTFTSVKEKKILLSFHRCSLLLGTPKAKEVEEFLWVYPHQLVDFQFPPANKEVIQLILQKKRMWQM